MNPTTIRESPAQTCIEYNQLTIPKLLLRETTSCALKWMYLANYIKTDISTIKENLRQSIEQTPSISDPSFSARMGHINPLLNVEELLIRQQVTIRTLYCNQLIRKVTKSCINYSIDKIVPKTSCHLYIFDYRERLLQMIPPKKSLELFFISESRVFEIVCKYIDMLNTLTINQQWKNR
jgi:hypothetical protein